MDGSSQPPARRGSVERSAAEGASARARGFVLLQLTFWGAFLAMRALASLIYYPDILLDFMGARVFAVGAYACVTTGVHLVVSHMRRWRPEQRLWLTLALCALALAPMHQMEAALTRAYAPSWPAEQFVDYMFQFGWVLLAWAGYYYALDHAAEVRCQARALTEAQALAHAAQLKMLRYQLNPHFLFNSLNAVSALVLEGRNPEAESMLLKLSRFLRHTIDTDPTQLARLGDEAQLQRLYLEMEAIRFGERMDVVCNVPEALHDCLVPSLLLQPIVENAIKHGVAKTGSGRIAITAEADKARLRLTVENDGPLGAFAISAVGLGLRNTQDRLRTTYGDNARLAMTARPEGGARVVIDLPLQRAR